MQSVIDDLQIARHLCKTDLKFLCRDILGMGMWDVCHDWLDDFLVASKKKKKLILLPREHLKTSLITIGKSIQHILDNPDTSILFANVIQSNAESFLRVVKDFLTTKSILPKLFGKFESEKWNETEIIVSQRSRTQHSPTISVAGADKSVTSQHYDVIFLDDIVNRQTVSTLEQIDKTKRFYSDVLDLLKKPDGVLYVLGTRWDERDIYGRIMKDFADDFDTFNLMATTDGRLDDEEKIIFKKKFSIPVLKELKKQKGSYEFSLQYLNTITNPESRIFNPPARYWDVNDLQVMAPALTFDPATSDKKGSCDAVVMASGLNESNQLCALGYTIFREQDKTPVNMLGKIFDYISRFSIRNVIVEINGGQEVWVHLINDEAKKRRVSINIVEVHQSKSKESRILALQAYWERGDLLLKRGMIELEDQFDRFRVPINGIVDVLDALAMRIQEEIPMSISSFPVSVGSKVNRKYGWVNGAYIPPGPQQIMSERALELIPS